MDKILKQRLESLLTLINTSIKEVPFESLIQGLYGTEVLKFPKDSVDSRKILDQITKSMKKVCERVQAKPIERNRANEAGSEMKKIVLEVLRKHNLCAMPTKIKSAKGRTMGYPDFTLEIDNVTIYLHVKTYSEAQYNSTQRSFYFSRANNIEVTENAHHLLVGFKFVREENKFTPVDFKIVDLYGLNCDLKFEFNSNNKRLYKSTERILFPS